jgi:hypothetical protein
MFLNLLIWEKHIMKIRHPVSNFNNKNNKTNNKTISKNNKGNE